MKKEVIIISVINLFIYIFIFIHNGFNIESILYSLMSTVLVKVALVDFKTYEIPFYLNVIIFILALIKIVSGRDALALHLLGFISVSGFMIICVFITKVLKKPDAFGGGDIKLMAAAGLFLGVHKIIFGFWLACVFASVIHIIRMIISKEGHILALGPYLSAGVFVAMIF